jgi:hypothetical protein
MAILDITAYMHQQGTRPDTLAIALTDSPMGFLAWTGEKFWEWADTRSRRSRPPPSNVAVRPHPDDDDNINNNNGDDERQSVEIAADGTVFQKSVLPGVPPQSQSQSSPLPLFYSHLSEIYDPDWLLANAVTYIATGTIASSLRLYYEALHSARFTEGMKSRVIAPTFVADAPAELARVPSVLLKYRYPNLLGQIELPRGGHFLAVEEPALLADEVRVRAPMLWEAGEKLFEGENE